MNLPTPTVSDVFTDRLRSTQQKEGSMHSVTLPQAVRMVSDTIERGQAAINDLPSKPITTLSAVSILGAAEELREYDN